MEQLHHYTLNSLHEKFKLMIYLFVVLFTIVFNSKVECHYVDWQDYDFATTKAYNNKENIYSFQMTTTTISSAENPELATINYQENIFRQRKIKIYYNENDISLIENFILQLKRYNGNWASHGLQRIVRLNAACSKNYVSLRKSRIRADVPLDEAFKDPYTLVEQQMYRKLVALKSVQTNRYVCFNTNNGNFHLKPIEQLDNNCIFTSKMKSYNQYEYAIGSNMSVYFSFNKNGRLINYNRQMLINQNLAFNNAQCTNYANLFYLHTKLSDNAQDYYSMLLSTDSSIYPTEIGTTNLPITTTTTTTTRTTSAFSRAFTSTSSQYASWSSKSLQMETPNYFSLAQNWINSTARKKIILHHRRMRTRKPKQRIIQLLTTPKSQLQDQNFKNYDHLIYYYKPVDRNIKYSTTTTTKTTMTTTTTTMTQTTTKSKRKKFKKKLINYNWTIKRLLET